MKERILSNWTFRRFLYLAMGLFMVIESIRTQQWFGLLFGGYFAAMGLFAFGCASGVCGSYADQKTSDNQTHNLNASVEFEEIKSHTMPKQ